MIMMSMEEESSERSESRRTQTEQERERRRMRDRQRRQSMTLEQRERHLARRRRNYQLRRLRAESTISDSTATISVDQTVDSAREIISSQDDHRFNLNPIGFEKLSSEICLRSEGLETLAQKAVNATKRLRLSRLRCLARSFNRFGGGVGGIHEKEAAVLSKRDADTTLQLGENESSGLPSGLRLNRIKRLARGLSAVNTEINGQSHQVEQNGVVSSGEHKFGHRDHC